MFATFCAGALATVLVRIPEIAIGTSACADTIGADAHDVFAGVTLAGAPQLLRWMESPP